MKKLLVSLLILSSCVQAPLRQNTLVPALPSSRMPAQSQTDFEAQQTCARDLCGDPRRFQPSRGEGAFKEIIPQNVKSFLEVSVNPLLAQLVDDRANMGLLKIGAIEILTKRLERDFLTFPQITFVVISTLTRRFGELSSEVQVPTDKGVGIAFDYEKLRLKQPDFDPVILKKAVTIINAFLASAEAKEAYAYQGLSYDFYFQLLQQQNPSYPLNELQQSDAFTLTGEIRRVMEKLGVFSYLNFDLDVIGKVSRNELLTDTEKQEYMKLRSATLSMKGVLNIDVQMAAVENLIDVTKLLREIKWPETASISKTLLGSDRARAFAKQKVSDYCEKAIAPAIAASPSDLRLKKAFAFGQSVKVAAKTAAALYFSGQALGAAQSAIDRVEFVSPVGIEKSKANMLEKFGKDLKILKQQKRIFETATAGQLDWKSLFVSTFVEMNARSEEILFQATQDSCDGMRPAFFEDGALTAIGKIKVGWQSLLYPGWGAGIIAHELGHVVSAAATGLEGSEKYDFARQCTARLHKQMLTDTVFNLSSPNNEEDWSDLFAATTMKELNKTWPFVQNFGCALLPLASDDGYGKLDLFSGRGSKGHSNDLFRAIHIQVNTDREIPNSCLGLVKGKKTELFSSPCGK